MGKLSTLLMLSWLAGCTGAIEPIGETGDSPQGGHAPASATPDPKYEAPPGCAATAVPSHVVVHRLNRVEYNNTIRDLLGNSSRPADEFPVDDSFAGFDNNASALHVSGDLLNQLDGAAKRLAQNAVAQPGFAICAPSGPGDAACARRVLAPFARRAWRRPVADDEIDELLKVFKTAAANGDTFTNGLGLAVETVLLSPNFLYRFELPANPKASAPYALDPYALASRLSYFLWSSMPDEALMAVAESGRLLDPDGLSAEVTRMLGDAKAAALADNLAGQWLGGRAVVAAAPSPSLFPQFDPRLRAAIPTETSLFLNAFFQENLDLRTLLTASFTFLNQRLAQHYKITGVTGDQFRKFPLVGTGAVRGGILTQATFHVATSKPTEPIIPRRGKWVRVNLLCSPPPDPPADAVTKQADIEKALPADATRRQVAEARDARPECGPCHAAIDPIGLALDKYDAIGAYRDVDDKKRPIDASGTLSGKTFNGPRQLGALLKDDEGLPGCIASALFRYALGRVVTAGDHCLLADIVKKATEKSFGAQDLVSALVTSSAFRFQFQNE